MHRDHAAIRELHRTLRDSGTAILQVPIKGATTDEDPTITDAAERAFRFGQHDHVRRCGSDYVQRVRDAGFVVETIDLGEALDADDRRRYDVLPGEPFFFCRKTGAG